MLWIIISVIIVILDQITKYAVVQNIDIGEMIPVIDQFFYLTLHMNPGAAWGMLQNGRIFFLIIIPIISAFVVYYMFKNKNKFLRFTLALILAGAVGNYIDRLLFGEVRDFLLFYIGSYPFPIFNVADISVTCGTIAMAVYVLFIYKEPKKEEKKELDEQEEMEERIERKDLTEQEELCNKSVELTTEEQGKMEDAK